MLNQILIPVGVLGVMALLFGVGLAVAARIFEVKQDERVPLVRAALPGANCGGCGLPGCDALAVAIVDGNAAVNACPVGGSECAAKIGEIMGVAAGSAEPTVARVICQGTCEHSPRIAEYYGELDCREALIANGGNKKCRWGCLGMGTCVKACMFDAIKIGENGLPEVDMEKCTSCGACVTACPKDLMDIVPQKQLVFVECSSKDKGKIAKANCDVACIGCRACVKVCPTEAITVTDNLARIDYEKCIQCGACVEKCPTGAIIMEDRVIVTSSDEAENHTLLAESEIVEGETIALDVPGEKEFIEAQVHFDSTPPMGSESEKAKDA